MSNPIKHVRETGEFVQISPVDWTRKPNDPIPSDNETLLYWKKAFECKVRENARLEDRIKFLRMELASAIKYNEEKKMFRVINTVQSKLINAIVIVRDAVVFVAFVVLFLAFMFGFFSGI